MKYVLETTNLFLKEGLVTRLLVEQGRVVGQTAMVPPFTRQW